MDQQVKSVWVAKLRSGEYLQGEMGLATSDHGVTEYCCLGVLCDISPVESTETDACRCSSDCTSKDIRWLGSQFYLPQAVEQWAGIEDSDLPGDIKITLTAEDRLVLTEELGHNEFLSLSDRASTSLAKLNDAGLPFSRIADIIEKYL